MRWVLALLPPLGIGLAWMMSGPSSSLADCQSDLADVTVLATTRDYPPDPDWKGLTERIKAVKAELCPLEIELGEEPSAVCVP